MDKKRLNLRKVAMIFACLAVTAVFTSCDKPNNEQKSSEKQITAFVFTTPAATGVINETAKTIAVKVPAGTTLTDLVPTITVSEKASVNPLSGVAQNFTNPATYTVTAEDGSTAVYTVTVSLLPTPDPLVDEGVIINGIKWATRNVNAPGTFANYSHDLGMHYQWNRAIGWYNNGDVFNQDMVNHLGGRTWDKSIPGGSSWTNNVCPPGWRIPTINEFQSLIDAGSEYVLLNGIYGRYFGSGNAKIFLPFAGVCWNDDGSLGYVGYVGLETGHCFYWSSMPYEHPSYPGQLASYMDITETFALVSQGWRSFGCCVRCVAQ